MESSWHPVTTLMYELGLILDGGKVEYRRWWKTFKLIEEATQVYIFWGWQAYDVCCSVIYRLSRSEYACMFHVPGLRILGAFGGPQNAVSSIHFSGVHTIIWLFIYSLSIFANAQRSTIRRYTMSANLGDQTEIFTKHPPGKQSRIQQSESNHRKLGFALWWAWMRNGWPVSLLNDEEMSNKVLNMQDFLMKVEEPPGFMM